MNILVRANLPFSSLIVALSSVPVAFVLLRVGNELALLARVAHQHAVGGGHQRVALDACFGEVVNVVRAGSTRERERGKGFYYLPNEFMRPALAAKTGKAAESAAAVAEGLELTEPPELIDDDGTLRSTGLLPLLLLLPPPPAPAPQLLCQLRKGDLALPALLVLLCAVDGRRGCCCCCCECCWCVSW